MRKILSTALLAIALAGTGCKTTGVAPPLAPGFQNIPDQQMYGALKGARNFYLTIQCETQGLNYSPDAKQCMSDPNIKVPMVLSQTEKDTFNRFGASLNIAEQLYLAYHAGTATQAQAQAAVNTVSQQQATLPTPGGK